MQRVLIIGGGISGLALAYRLEQQCPDIEVTVLESQSRIGGTIGTERHQGFRYEIGPNGFLDNNPSTWNLCNELGLQEQLIPASESARKNRFLYLKGRLHALPSGLVSFLFSDVLSWRAKFAILTERFRGRSTLADESVDAFFRRRTHAEVAETLVDAFITGIHAGDPSLLSIRAALPRMAQLEQEYGSLLGGMGKAAKKKRAEAEARGEEPRKGLRTWSFREGLGHLIDTLQHSLHRPPLTGKMVRRIERTDGKPGWVVHGSENDQWQADVVVLTCPAYAQSAMLYDLDAELAEKIGAIPYNRIAVVALGYRREGIAHSLDGFGYLTPGRAKRDVLGVQWCSTIFPDRAPEGMVLMRAMCGGWHRAEMVGWSDEALLNAVRSELALTLGIRAEPVFHQIVRWHRAIPQYHLGHLDRVAWIDERRQRYPGLFLGGNCYRGVALNDCVEQASLLAETVARTVTG